MTAYYNEIDPYAAEWLRNLIAAVHIADGIVDTRSIEDVRPADLTEFTQCHFFAGIGGWSLALRLAGWDDTRPVWTGSCPCQPFSQAGEGRGMDDDRHLWPAWFHLIGQCRPATIFGEQVEAAIAHGWLDLVQDDLEGIGYAFAPVGLPAASVGAPHIRHRLWWVAQNRIVANAVQPGRAERGSESRGGSTAGRGASGPPAHARHEPARRITGPGETQGGRASSEPARCGAPSELANATIPRPLLGALGRVRGGEEGAGPRDAESERRGPDCGMGDTAGQRLEGGRDQSAHAVAQPPGKARAAGPLAGFWSDADWIACRDGKARPVEPGSFPLAPRLPNHVGRLRAYGNAIVPQVAAEVIGAFMECAP